MPDVTVHNQTSSCLNVGFCIATPLAYKNEVKPNETIRLHLSTFVHTFEARIDSEGNRFSPNETWQTAGEIGTAVAAGSAAVALGTGWLFGSFGGRFSPVNSAAFTGAGAAWGAAHKMGAQYGWPREGVVVSVPGLWIPFYEKHYSVRFIGDKFVLWDEDEKRVIG